MQENEPVEKINSSSPARGGAPRKNLTFTFEERLRAVKLQLEEGFTQPLISQEMGVSIAALGKWVQRYRKYGEEGLKTKLQVKPKRRGRRAHSTTLRAFTVPMPIVQMTRHDASAFIASTGRLNFCGYKRFSLEEASSAHSKRFARVGFLVARVAPGHGTDATFSQRRC